MSSRALVEESQTHRLIDAWQCPACRHINEIRDSCICCGQRRQETSVRVPVELAPASRPSQPYKPPETVVASQTVQRRESTQDQTRPGWAISIYYGYATLRLLGFIFFIVWNVWRWMTTGIAEPRTTFIILAAGVICTSAGTYAIWRAFRSKLWLATFCEVTRASPTFYRTWVLNYRYRVSGEEYIGRWTCRALPSSVLEEPVVVFYDPGNPKQSIVDRREYAGLARRTLILGLALLTVGLLFWLS
jgi:hypothetical protein